MRRCNNHERLVYFSSSKNMSGFQKGVVFTQDLLRTTFGAFGLIYGFTELVKSDSNDVFHDAAASTIVQIFTLLCGILLVKSIIDTGMSIRSMCDEDEKKKGADMTKTFGVSSSLFVASALVAGIGANKVDAPPSALEFGKADPFPALFVSAGVLVALEWIVDMIMQSKDESEGEDTDEDDITHVHASAMVALVVSFVFSLLGFLFDETQSVEDQKYNTSSAYDVAPNMFSGDDAQVGIFFGLLFGGLSFVAVVVTLYFDWEERRLALTASGLAAGAAASIALEVGRHFHKSHYESRMLHTQFWYVIAALSALQASKLAAQDKAAISEMKRDTGKRASLIMLAGTVIGVLAFILTAFWTDTFEGDYEFKNETRGDDHKKIRYSDADVLKAREFGAYALYISTFVGLSVLVFKLMEVAVSKTLARVACCKAYREDGSRGEVGKIMTHRTESLVLLSLSFALFAGARDPNGAEQMKPEQYTVVSWFIALIIAASIARLVAFQDFIEKLRSDPKYKALGSDDVESGASGAGSLGDNLRKLVGYCWNASALEFFSGDADSIVKEIIAMLLLLVSGLFQLYATYWSEYKGDKTVEFHVHSVAFWLTVAHFVLVLLGMCLQFCGIILHAGSLPFVRFGVSTTITILLSIATGINIVEGGWDQWVVGGLLAYIMFDIISDGRY